ncbi:MAG: EamA family transporter [Deltaproteobacteria bacterium]|nr:EamA family transporter [Deltaproteobacteria bacterium]
MIWISLILCSGFFFSLNHIVRKRILKNADVTDMMILTGSFGFFCLIPFAGEVDFGISSSNIILISINAVFAFTGSYLLNIAYKHCEISTVSPLLNFNPLLVILLSYFQLGEVLNSQQFAGVMLILLGGYIVTLKEIRNFFNPFTALPAKYFLIVLATLVLWSFCPVINRVVLFETDAMTHIFFFAMFIFIIQLVLIIAMNRYKRVASLAKKQWFLIIIAGGFWIISDFLHLKALAVPAAVVSLAIPAKRLSNLLTVVLGGTVFKEKSLVVKSMACIFMIAGLYVIGIN